ncbi:hypothetical protein CRUP_038306 [Coryphaenoides rupestris]|nr:hypothetical protein CRUP_038306 [Coryphaenoides rupestris]
MRDLSSRVRVGGGILDLPPARLRNAAVEDELREEYPNNVPNIAILGSGGGQRAMVGMLGSLYQMGKEGLLDAALYVSGVSGSTW